MVRNVALVLLTQTRFARKTLFPIPKEKLLPDLSATKRFYKSFLVGGKGDEIQSFILPTGRLKEVSLDGKSINEALEQAGNPLPIPINEFLSLMFHLIYFPGKVKDQLQFSYRDYIEYYLLIENENKEKFIASVPWKDNDRVVVIDAELFKKNKCNAEYSGSVSFLYFSL